jgi:hypothetical protein
MHIHVCILIIFLLIFGMQICTYYFFYFFFTILGSSSGQKVGSYFRSLSTWKKSKTGGFQKPYRVTNSSWVDDISKSTFNFKMNIFLIHERNQSAIKVECSTVNFI